MKINTLEDYFDTVWAQNLRNVDTNPASIINWELLEDKVQKR